SAVGFSAAATTGGVVGAPELRGAGPAGDATVPARSPTPASAPPRARTRRTLRAVSDLRAGAATGASLRGLEPASSETISRSGGAAFRVADARTLRDDVRRQSTSFSGLGNSDSSSALIGI